MLKRGKLLAKLLIIVASIVACLYTAKINLSDMVRILTLMPWSAAICILTLFVISFYLVALRSYLSYRQFNLNITYGAAQQGLLSGLLGGVVPMIGSVLSQAYNLHQSSNVSSITSSFIYFYDKFVMAFAGLLLVIVVNYNVFNMGSLFQSLAYNPENSTNHFFAMIEFFIAIVMSLSATYFLVLTNKDKQLLKQYFNMRNICYFACGVAISICTWFLTANCFFICLRSLIPELSVNYSNIIGCSVLISFIASLPITVNGWGLREFAAVTFFSILAIPGDIALAVSITIGVFSMISLLFIWSLLGSNLTSFWNKIASLAK